jgi:hypothetical protein
MAMDADTLKFIDDAKKGKPRRFAMVLKGEKIVSLVVYKKGSLDRYKKQAKEEGKGLFYHGVVDGKGQNLVFKLCRVDGFEEPPGKDMKLKQYLKDEGGLQFKPTYEIVDVLPTLVDEEDEGAATEEEETSTTGDDAALAAKLNDALSKMTPLIKEAMAADPAKKQEILVPASSIKAALAEGRLDQAKTEIVKYGALLKQLAAGKSAAAGGDEASGGMEAWQKARAVAVDQLTTVAKAVAATKDPDAKGVIIQLQSIIKNLTHSPDDANKVAELDRYLRDDDVIAAAEEVPPRFGTIKLREPLLKALAALES